MVVVAVGGRSSVALSISPVPKIFHGETRAIFWVEFASKSMALDFSRIKRRVSGQLGYGQHTKIHLSSNDGNNVLLKDSDGNVSIRRLMPVFVLRRAPDWPALASDSACGLPVDPRRYVPADDVPSFPAHITRCIETWDATYRVGFFACRAELRAIAQATLDAVEGGLVLTPVDLPRRLPAGDFRLFFVDDDDWFAPDTAARIAVAGQEDVAVFPLLRLDAPVRTFARNPTDRSPIIGAPREFSHRYQTNNYGLHSRLCTSDRLDALSDHMRASRAAEPLGLLDAYHDVMISVTNKTPVSASVIARITRDETLFRAHVEAFVSALQGLRLPPDAAWMREPVRRTASLFSRALGEGAAADSTG